MPRPCLLAPFIVAALATFSLHAADEEIPRGSVTIFGGNGSDGASHIAIDAAGNSYVLGSIGSTEGVTPAFATAGNHLLKFNSSNELQWAVPTSGWIHDVAATPDGSAFVLSSRTARDNVFVTRFGTTGATVYTTDLPGLTIDTSTPERPAIAVSPAGEVAVAGRSEAGAFGVPSTTIGPVAGENAVVVTLDPRGALSSATVIGGSEADAATDVAVDAAGSVYVVGRTRSKDFPVSARAAQTPGGNCRAVPSPLYLFECDDAFLVELDARRQPVFATRYGGSYTDRASAVAVDRGGGIYVAGATSSFDFPVVRALQATARSCGGQPVIACGTPFVMRFDRTGSTVDFATRLGGTSSTTIKGLAVDPAGHAYLVGVNSGNDFPIRRALQPDNGAGPMLVTDDGARTWAVGSGLRANIIYQIAWSTATPPLAYAGSDRGLFVSSDFGHTWTQAPGVPSGTVYTVAVDPATPAIVYAAVAVDIYNPAPPGSPYGLLKSLDGGRSWTMINNGMSDADRSFIRSVAIAHSQPWTLYAVAGSHIYRSDDGGSSWRESTNSAGAVAVNPANPSIVYATASAAAFTVSTDGGRSWRKTWSRTEHSGQRAGKILVNPARPTEVVIPTEFGVVRSRDSGETWESISLGDIEGAFPAAVDPTTPGAIWIGRRSLDRIADGSSRLTPVDDRFHFIDYLSAQRGHVLLSQGWAVNGFAAAMDAAGNLLWSTYLGGIAHGGSALGVAADATSVHVVGNTSSEIWPLAQASGRQLGGNSDLYLARILIPR